METTLDVRGMTCSHCERAVEGALQELEGVIGVEVNLGTNRVDVTYDEAQVTVKDMQKAVEDQGYEIVM
ncbi:copper chaperone CopZ [Virgibacillus sediminis]|uniref:Copper chaperone CopZ n=1 Tax=Virgibacillus sediminis TaxID=202260 RepID=A0ABV7A2K2_9BACI